jgi:hypothetical protein
MTLKSTQLSTCGLCIDADPEPRDAAIGYALAAAFGTGAEPMWKLTLEAVLAMWP